MLNQNIMLNHNIMLHQNIILDHNIMLHQTNYVGSKRHITLNTYYIECIKAS